MLKFAIKYSIIKNLTPMRADYIQNHLDPYLYDFLRAFESTPIKINNDFFATNKYHESGRVEYKEIYEDVKVLKEVIAFANTDGGHVFVGVEDENLNIKGIAVPGNMSHSQFASSKQDSINQTLGFSVAACIPISINGTSNILLHIKVKKHQGAGCPIFAHKDKVAYQRVGTHAVPMNPQEIIGYAYTHNINEGGIDSYLNDKYQELCNNLPSVPELGVYIVNDGMFQGERDFQQNLAGQFFIQLLNDRAAQHNINGVELLDRSGMFFQAPLPLSYFTTGSYYNRACPILTEFNAALQKNTKN